jgi:hypothetical protein
MRMLVSLLAVPTLALAQSTQQPPPAAPPATSAPPASSADQAAAPAAPAAPDASQTASPEIVGSVAKDVGITAKQAEGAAGALFGLAKTKLPAADFAKVAAAVPNMDGLLKAAPIADFKVPAIDSLAGQTSGLGAIASVAAPLAKLGIKPETMTKLAPALVKAVQSKGGAEVASLLASALK